MRSLCTTCRPVRSAFSAIVFGTTFIVLAGADRWHVDGAAGDDNNAGTLWSTSFATVQKALSVADGLTDDQIWVAKGTYFPDEGTGQTPGDRGATFSLVDGVRIYGGFENGDAFEDRDPDANETILSGDIDNTGLLDSYHVVSGGSTITLSTILDGFTIELGRADGTAPVDQGGGIHLIEADPRIRRCVIRDCYAREAGGGIYVFKGNPTFVRCVFDSNVAMFRGGGLHFEGESGALTHAVVTNCVFTGNSTTTTIEFQARGAGAAILDATYEITNTLFLGNTSESFGAGAYFSSPTGVGDGFITNCTFAGNHAILNGGGVFGGGTFLTLNIDNCIFWDNLRGTPGSTEPSQIVNSEAIVNHSIVQGGWTGDGEHNIDADPGFIDGDGPDDTYGSPDDNVRVCFGSPAIDAGDNAFVPADDLDVDEDGNFTEGTPDQDLNDRIEDGLADFVFIVDIGAFEYRCIGDTDGNGAVGIVDFMDLLAAWGPNPGHPADLDRDDSVGVVDFLLLLANWGPCPACDEGPNVLTLEEELEDACLSEDDWDEYVDVMTDEATSQATKDRYDCWMRHYIIDCSRCSCPHTPTGSGCPNPDPFK